VLVGTDGPYHNVIKIRGPMPLSLADADQVVDTLARALRELPGRRETTWQSRIHPDGSWLDHDLRLF
jgi:hypothetical protein